MKPQAPAEYRGEFSPIHTNVPGMEICELMPLQAKIADKFAIIRGAQIANLHTGNMFYSGYPWQENPRASVPGEARRPAVGSVVSRLRPGPKDVPPYVSIENHFDWERAYYAGIEHEPLRFGSSSPRESIDNMGRRDNMTSLRLVDRDGLLRSLESVRREVELGVKTNQTDGFRQRALDIVTSSKVRDAFDLEKESADARARYGEGPFRHGPHPGRSPIRVTAGRSEHGRRAGPGRAHPDGPHPDRGISTPVPRCRRGRRDRWPVSSRLPRDGRRDHPDPPGGRPAVGRQPGPDRACREHARHGDHAGRRLQAGRG